MAKKVCDPLVKLISKDTYQIPIQAVVGEKVVYRTDVGATKDDIIERKILSHGHSGDPLRKLKLLKRQKEKFDAKKNSTKGAKIDMNKVMASLKRG
jgi:GTP-binding protein LepA